MMGGLHLLHHVRYERDIEGYAVVGEQASAWLGQMRGV